MGLDFEGPNLEMGMFFKMKRWADGALDEAFKGQNISTYIKTNTG